ncbi:MAG TPA: hypothetical protein VFB54_03525 [Burkholderiales bacterium]|jgi:hypothetical protein|nr:hypothetical protein [Burkholderiales bacterium]
MAGQINIRFPRKKDDDDGAKARGPYRVGVVYSVPAEVAEELKRSGAEVVAAIGKDDEVSTIEPRHRNHFDEVKAITKDRIAAEKAAAEAEAKATADATSAQPPKSTAPADAGAQTGAQK